MGVEDHDEDTDFFQVGVTRMFPKVYKCGKVLKESSEIGEAIKGLKQVVHAQFSAYLTF